VPNAAGRAPGAAAARAWADADLRAFVDSLPVAGVDGTLAHRLQGGAAAGQAFLKTGSLLDTRALAGYVRSRSGRVHAVAVFVNHGSAAAATPAIDAVIEQLARHG
jgi:D-alanyl-D-alanine carboxypeptidase/D-alanyl-D-alanine-endopeptidase (penicillin-binding protein 4)